MPRFRTRSDIRERVKREAQSQSATGAYTDANWNRTIAEAWGRVWWYLTRWVDGYGLKLRSFPIATISETLDFPPEMLELRALGIQRGQTFLEVRETTFGHVLRRGLGSGALLTTAAAGAEFLPEGPYIDDDGVTIIPQRLRFYPTLQPNDEVRIGMITHEPPLGDPDVPGDDATSIDLIAEPVEGALVRFARVIGATREDSTERRNAESALSVSMKEFSTVFGHRVQSGQRGADVHQTTRGPIGYGSG